MKLLFDQNISHRILRQLPEKFKGSSSVKNEGLLNASDKQIYDFARLHNFIIVTQDADFHDLNIILGFPPKIIWIRRGNLKTVEIADILSYHYDKLVNFADNKDLGCFEIFKFL
jgi:predicted nuclease of predicted toxin-antitoxin system